MLFLSIGLALAAIALFRRTTSSRLTSAVLGLAVFSSLFLAGFYYVSDRITGQGINESVFYFMATGSEGGSLKDFQGIILGAVALFIAASILSFLTYRLSRSASSGAGRGSRLFIGGLLIAASFAVNPGFADLGRLFLWNPADKLASRPPEYLAPDDVTWKFKKNLVYIYLESLERTYLDEDIFPGLAPNLKRLEQESLHFVNLDRSPGTDWTIGGMVGSQCGIPLVTPSGHNGMTGIDKFLPGARCIGDILSNAGYDLNYVGGASMRFAGKGNFYQTHGFGNVEGREELLPQLDDKDYANDWGLYDDTLFGILKRKYDALSNSGGPFGLFAITLDTHHPIGFESKSCANSLYGDGKNTILNAVHCTDKLVSDFVTYVQNSEEFKNTVVVIASDHLAMRNTAWDFLQRGKRKNLFIVLGATNGPKEIAKAGTTLDAAATVLPLLGAQLDGLGFGRNLLGTSSSLAEASKSFDDFIRGEYDFVKSMWNFPQVTEGVTVDVENMTAKLEGRDLNYPLLLVLDKNAEVEEVRFESSDDPRTLVTQISEFPPEQRFLWIDKCSRTAVLVAPSPAPEGKGAGVDYCLVITARDAASAYQSVLKPGFSLSQTDINEHLAQVRFSEHGGSARKKNLETYAKFGTTSFSVYSLAAPLVGDYVVVSAGGLNMSTRVTDQATQESARVGRGLTLLGLSKNGKPVEIRRVDKCSEKQASSGDRSFREDIDRLSGKFGAFIILAHDSATCSHDDFSSLFAGLQLSKWRKIALRTPYIAVVAGNGQTQEYVGAPESVLGVEIKNFIAP